MSEATVELLDDARGRRILFGETTEEEMLWALNEGLESYFAWLKSTATAINGQLAGYNDGTFVPDGPDWRRRALTVKRHADRAICALEPVLKSQRRQANNVGKDHELSTVLTALRRARHAIHTHREATLRGELEPTDADLDLWSIVDEEDA